MKPVMVRAWKGRALIAVAALAPVAVHAQLDRSKPPVLGPAPQVKLPPVTVRQLPNGLRLMIVERHQLPVADFQLIVPMGATANPENKAGLANLTTEMLPEGTTTRSSLQIDDQEAFLGVSLDAASRWDATTISLTTPTAQLDSALALFADVVLRPSFVAKEFDRLKQERLTDLLQLRDEGPAIADRAFASIVFGAAHPYGRPAIGTETSVQGMSIDDIKQFYQTYFTPAGATLIVVGDVTPDNIERRIGTLFGGWKALGTVKVPVADSISSTATTSIYLIDKPGAPQSSFRIGLVGVPRSTQEYFALEVMNTALGGSFTSRLNQNLRETKGYTYGAGSRFDMRKSAGPFMARAEIVAEKTDSALIEFMKELRAIRDTIPVTELTRTKRYLQLQLPSAFETNSDVAQQLAVVALYGLPLDYYNGYVSRVEAVTQADVQRVAQRYVDPARLAIVIVGDRKAIEPKLQALKVGPISVRDINGNVVP